MPCVEHQHCIPLDEEDPETIWRYMDFTQFVSILENEELFLPRADNLGDSFEGSLPHQNEEARRRELENYPAEWPESLLPKFRRICTRHTFLSCWHLNEVESAAMWDLYLKSNQGLCIESSISNLESALENTNQEIYLSKVNYVDYREEVLEDRMEQGIITDTLSPFLHKRKSFSHENEFRAVIHDPPWADSESSIVTSEDIRQSNLENSAYESGRTVNIDVKQLIDSIRISHEAESWISDLVRNVCETHDLDSDLVIESAMEDNPSY